MIPERELFRIVSTHPGRNVHQLCEIVQLYGFPPIHKSNLNSWLYSTGAPFEWRPGRGNERLWYAVDIPRTQDVTLTERMELYPWQAEALKWWKQRHCRGVVEAVTGSGKTRLALAAIAEQIANGYPAVVVVPNIALQQQWATQIDSWLRDGLGMDFTLGYLGGGRYDVDQAPDVLVAVANSASTHPLLDGRSGGLIVADEVHHYGAPTWSLSLEPQFAKRLGLTGTYERKDHGVEEHLDPYFGKDYFIVDYARARRDDVIAPFKIAYIGVRFSADEIEDYKFQEGRAYRTRQRLINVFGLPEEPFGEFIRAANSLSQGGHGEATGIARTYLDAFTKKRHLLAGASQKLVRTKQLAPAIRAANRTILFAQTKEAATTAIGALNAIGVSGAVLDSSMEISERKEVFAGFESGDHELVAAPRLLDEGIDVPAADLAIVLASNRNRLQLVQRLGRVVRKKEDGRMARLAVLFVEGTTEDPDNNANEDFLYLVREVAEDIQYFGSTDSLSSILSYLNSWKL